MRELPRAAPGTVRQALEMAERLMDEAGVGECIADARLLLAHATKASPTWLFAHGGDPVAPEAWDEYRGLVARRAAREPLQHLLGAQEFWSLRFEVNADVLVPRPETELLVEVVLEGLADVPRPRIADVGTGSGCVAIALLSELPGARLVGSDVSGAALAVASRNAQELGVADRLELVEGALAEPLRNRGPFDAVAANLPYVSRAEWEDLEPEVRDHDPRCALVGGEQGSELILELVAQAPGLLAPGGLLALEVGQGQAGEVAAALERAGFRDVHVRRDLAGIERVVGGRNPGGRAGQPLLDAAAERV